MKRVVILWSCLIFGCASARDMSRAESLLFLPKAREIVLPLRSADQPAAFIAATCDRGTRSGTRCSHVSVRLDTVLTAATASLPERNRILALLLGLSDYNCSAFTSHASGRKAQLQTANTILNGVSSALAAKSEKHQSLVDMVTLANKTTDGIFAQPLQLGSAESAVEIAIGDKRRELRERIAKHEEPYSLLEALADVTAYDDTCSLQRGKELALQAAARSAREEAERVLAALSQPVPPVR